MVGVLTHALGFACIIVAGFLLNSLGFISGDARKVLPEIMLKVTLPASIAVNLNGTALDLPDLYFVVLGALFNVVALTFAFFYGRSRDESGFAMVNLAGYNIGCFAMPFISGMLDQQAMAQAGLFDMGNSIMCLGVNYAVASQVERGRGFSFSYLLNSVLRSVPVATYAVMVVLCLAGLGLPELLMDPLQIAARANPFIAMMVIGISMGFASGFEMLPRIASYCGMRLGLSFVAIALLMALPIPSASKGVAVVLCLAPISAVSSVYTRYLNRDAELSACINSAYVPISIIAMSVAIALLP
ncbi:MAG: hypothetical protein SOU51_06530 [Collinsella sp.]|nr:hypothetical protein [Collinsella sp.]